MTIFVNDRKGITAIEVEYYVLNEEKLIGEFITINGRKGKIIPYETKEKKIINELYQPFSVDQLNRTQFLHEINGYIEWDN